MTTIWNNDYARAFFKDHGYPEQYNDGLFAWLKDVYGVTNSSLPDLLARYLREYGDDFNMRVLGKSAVPIPFITAAATFTSISVSDNGSGLVRLTSAGVHGLTTSPAVGANIYVSAGTGWTAGFYEIVTVVDTTSIDIDLAFDAGLGSPTISLAGDDTALVTVEIPALNANSCIEIDYTGSGTNSSNSKVWRVSFGGTNFTGVVTTTSGVLTHRLNIANRGATNSQTGSMNVSNNTGYGVGSALPITASIDTSVPTTLSIIADPAAANEVMQVERYLITLFA